MSTTSKLERLRLLFTSSVNSLGSAPSDRKDAEIESVYRAAPCEAARQCHQMTMIDRVSLPRLLPLQSARSMTMATAQVYPSVRCRERDYRSPSLRVRYVIRSSSFNVVGTLSPMHSALSERLSGSLLAQCRLQ